MIRHWDSMETQKIKFLNSAGWLNKDSVSTPKPIIKTIPDWYRKADRFAKKPNGDYWDGADVPGMGMTGKIPTWKACPAVFDIMGSGYAYLLPCDLNFYKDKNGKISVKIDDVNYKNFCLPRDPMPQFEHPSGYYKAHFALMPDWAVIVPEGYSVLYSHPFNRYELPFLMTNGIIDNDKVNLAGSMPFFVRDGFEGIVPAGTPYAQIFPFKRENWESEVIIEDAATIRDKQIKNSAVYRKPDGGIYKNEVWEKRTYN